MDQIDKLLPTLISTCHALQSKWAKSEMKGATERAVKLMREMPDYGVAPDECSYNSVLHAMTKESDPKWVKRAEEMFEEMKEKVSVSQITYHVMMNIYGKSKDKDGARKAEELLRRMVQEKDIFPSDISYNICIDAYARRGDHGNAVRLLEEMISLSDKGNEECRPTIHSFASVVIFMSSPSLLILPIRYSLYTLD